MRERERERESPGFLGESKDKAGGSQQDMADEEGRLMMRSKVTFCFLHQPLEVCGRLGCYNSDWRHCVTSFAALT